MFEIIGSLLGSALGGLLPYIIAAGGALVALVMARRSGVKAERGRQAQETLKGIEKGRQGAQKASDDLAKGKTPAQIKAENDAKWK